MKITAVTTGSKRFGPDQFSAFVFYGGIIHHAHMRHQEHQIFLPGELADAGADAVYDSVSDLTATLISGSCNQALSPETIPNLV